MAYGSYIGLERGRRGVGLDCTSNGALDDVEQQIFSGNMREKPEAAQIATLEAKYGHADREIGDK